MVAFQEDQTARLLLFGPGNGSEPWQGVFEPPGECGTAVQPWAGWSGAARLGLCCLCAGAGGSALRGTGWVAQAGMFPACLYVLALASPSSQEQTGTEGRICLINDFVARPAQ